MYRRRTKVNEVRYRNYVSLSFDFAYIAREGGEIYTGWTLYTSVR